MLVGQDSQTPQQGGVDADRQTHVAIFKGMMVATFPIFVAYQRQPNISCTPDDFTAVVEMQIGRPVNAAIHAWRYARNNNFLWN